jgi:hypothetical protein
MIHSEIFLILYNIVQDSLLWKIGKAQLIEAAPNEGKYLEKNGGRYRILKFWSQFGHS